FGGFAPFTATWLIAQTGDPLSPAYYLMATALLSIIALMVIARRGRPTGEVGRARDGAPVERSGRAVHRPPPRTIRAPLNRPCPLWVISGHFGLFRPMSALPPKADID